MIDTLPLQEGSCRCGCGRVQAPHLAIALKEGSHLTLIESREAFSELL